MLRTLIAGALIGFAGKKLYESGALNDFANDAKKRLNEAGNARKTAKPAPAPVSVT